MAHPQLTDILGGQLDAAFIDVGNLVATGQIRQDQNPRLDRRKAIRHPAQRAHTDLELGYKDFEPYGFFTFFLPAATPRPIVDKLSAEIIRLLNSPSPTKPRSKAWACNPTLWAELSLPR